MMERGCDYCADDANMYFGHVEQIASDEGRQTVLLRCPRCDWFYEASPRGPKDARRISESEERTRFGL